MVHSLVQPRDRFGATPGGTGWEAPVDLHTIVTKGSYGYTGDDRSGVIFRTLLKAFKMLLEKFLNL